MTAPIPTSVVTVERWDNVTQLTWHPVEPPRPPLLPSRPALGMSSGEEATSARRWARHLARCWRRSQLRTDLADAGVLIGFAVAVLVCVALWPDAIGHLAHTLLGGTK